MSRHRNFRNRQYSYDYDDDYYDDYDDYYDEEEEAAALYEQNQRRELQRKQDEEKVAKSFATKKSVSTKNVNPKNGPSNVSKIAQAPPGFGKQVEDSDVVKLVNMGMGFSTAQCREALLMFDGSLELAMDYLLTSLDNVTIDNSSKVISTGSSIDDSACAKQSKKAVKKESHITVSIGGGGGKTKSNQTKEILSSTPIKESSKSSSSSTKLTPPPAAAVVRSDDKSSSTRLSPVARILTSRSRLSMVVLGHVDAGKSTLMGQLLLQLGHVDKRVISKFQKKATEIGKSSFALAWVFDTDESERERGVTMEVGTKFAKTKSHDIVILDAPGHKDFIPAMIHGAATADVGLLVISAAPGEFEAGFNAPTNGHGKVGQTREHIVLARGLGVSQMLVVVNKLDCTEPTWSQSRFQHIKNSVEPFILRNGLKANRVRFIPVSGLTGENVNGRTPIKGLGWYNGPSLVDAIDTFSPAQRQVDGPLRFIVTDVFAEGRGVVVSGRVLTGRISMGDKVRVCPIGDEASIHKIEHGVADSTSSPYSFNSNDGNKHEAVAGDNLDLVLSDIDVARVHPGSVLCQEKYLVPLKKRFTAKIVVMENLNVPIIKGAQVTLHMQCVDVPAVISKLLSTVGAKDTTLRPRRLVAGSNASVEIALRERLCLEKFSDCRGLGRFVLRRGGETIAVGVIEEFIR